MNNINVSFETVKNETVKNFKKNNRVIL